MGVDGNLIDWDIYPSRAKLEINTENDNYQTYSITYQGMQTIMELCYECEFVMTIIDNDEKARVIQHISVVKIPITLKQISQNY